jgi:hypothetical protein
MGAENWTLKITGDVVEFGLNDKIGADLARRFGAKIDRRRIEYRAETALDCELSPPIERIKKSAVFIDENEVLADVNSIVTVGADAAEVWLKAGAHGAMLYNLETGVRDFIGNYKGLSHA